MYLTRVQHRTFLSNIVTNKGKWCLYTNVRKRNELLRSNKKVSLRTKDGTHSDKTILWIFDNENNTSDVEHIELNLNSLSEEF